MNSNYQYRMHVPMTPMVKNLLIVNLVVWLLFQVILEGYFSIPFTRFFALYPGKVIFDFSIWQLLSYMFLHSISVSHILMNSLMLWFIGADLEIRWGKKFFLFFYLVTGVGAAVIYCMAVAGYFYATGNQSSLTTPVVGASGAIFGILLAYGMLFGERTMSFMMLFPMKAKHFVILLGAVEIMTLLSSGVMGGEVANLAHLGGLASGWLVLMGWARYQRTLQNKQNKPKKAGSLRLVVDNEKKDNKEPRYWN